ncbi:hypothetical protein AQULUS_09200 [Aquicella lusitana]|uniref:Uncharacterized protein n=2 Tax=Aquicella lusitana TaxID=254246 RepID=A0A370GZ25_9COXI|nr:hypothetical protein [Aquicella lusitana]RDI48760.1 hypothetical protein C8D86_10139 [Aquicella lusitana]VVC73188.1 hypothetical protein AQULUS_09200 [Aquicella lusitana]
MHTRIKEVVEDVLKAFQLLEECPHLKPLVRIESDLAFRELNLVLEQFVRSEAQINQILKNYPGPEMGAIQCCLETILIFLNDRWECIQGTDAVYFHYPNSRINRACLLLAQHLATLLETHPYLLLMPSIKNLYKGELLERLLSLNFNEFIMSDDTHTFIEVGPCLNAADKSRTTTLFHTDGSEKKLTENETQRIINHSLEALYYYDVIEYSTQRLQMPIPPNSSNELFKALKEQKCHMKVSYGRKGNQKLAETILRKIKDPHELVDIMTSVLSKNEWRDFIGCISTETLARIMLEGDALAYCIQKSKNYTGDADHDRAILFCFSEIYWRQREKEGEHTTSAGWLPNYSKKWLSYNYTHSLVDYGKKWMGGYNKDEKKAAVEVLQSFLISDVELGGLPDYLKIKKKEAVEGALFEGDLGMIASQAGLIADPAYFQKRTTGLLSYFN